MQGISSRIFAYGRYTQPISPWHEQRNELQREPQQHCRTAGPVPACLSSASPLLEQPCAPGVHESFGLSRIHFYAVKADPVRGDEAPSHDNKKGQPEEDGEPDDVEDRSDAAEYLRQMHVKPASRGTTVRAGGSASCRSGQKSWRCAGTPYMDAGFLAVRQKLQRRADGGRDCGMWAPALVRDRESGAVAAAAIEGVFRYSRFPARPAASRNCSAGARRRGGFEPQGRNTYELRARFGRNTPNTIRNPASCAGGQTGPCRARAVTIGELRPRFARSNNSRAPFGLE